MILDEKQMMQPPPAYAPTRSPGSSSHTVVTLTSFPSHILLNVIYATFPQTALIDEGKLERQRKTLYWLCTSLRLVDRTFYIASMHVLRSTYLPAYDSLVRSPYSSDPFPLLAPTPPTMSPSSPYSPLPPTSTTPSTPLKTIQRETSTLDHFIALKVREDVWADDSEFHLERDETFRDLFDLVQPRSRLEDLVRIYGVREGVVTISPAPSGSASSVRLPNISTGKATSSLPSPSRSPSSIFSFFSNSSKSSPPPAPAPTQTPITPLPFHLLSVSFSSRQVGLILHPTKRTIVTTQRTRDEKLERAAKRLVTQLRKWLEEGG